MSTNIQRQVRDSALKSAPGTNGGSPFDWYGLTELSRALLNELITFTAKEKLKESHKDAPDPQRIEKLTSLYREAGKVSKDSARFESLESMEAIISHYKAVLDAVREECAPEK